MSPFVTNVDLDHHDEFDDLAAVDRVFLAFLARRRPDGVAIMCLDDQGVARVLDGIAQPVETYGQHADATLRIVDMVLHPGGGRFGLSYHG